MSASKLIRIANTVDITCPWCMLSTHQLQLDVDAFKHEHPDVRFQIDMKPFLLMPNATSETQSVQEFQNAKFGEEKAKESRAMMAGKFAAVGLEFNQRLISTTVPAHRLLAQASVTKPEAQFPITLELMKAYHTRGIAPSDLPTLVSVAQMHSIFVDDAAARAFFDSDKLEQQVRVGNAQQREAGVKSVPHYVFQGSDVSPESQSKEQFLEIFRGYVA